MSDFAIIFHISDASVALDILKSHPFLFKQYPIYCSVVSDLVDERFVQKLQRKLNLQYLMVENKGMDIYAFFAVLNHFPLQQHTYLIKIHTKNDKDWRDRMILSLKSKLPLFGAPMPQESFIGDLREERFCPQNVNNNYYWFAQLYNAILLDTQSSKEPLPPLFTEEVDFSYQYNGGTIFVVRRDCALRFSDLLHRQGWINRFNALSKDSFDESWYHYYYIRNNLGERNNHLIEAEKLQQHYQHNRNTHYGNGFHLSVDRKKDPSLPSDWPADKISSGEFVGWSIRDAMFENAVESIFYTAALAYGTPPLPHSSE